MTVAKCTLCGEPMPAGEEMFKYHGFSGPCPRPPLPKFSRRYRKKPVVIEAMQLPSIDEPASEELIAFLNSAGDGVIFSDYDGGVSIATLEGTMRGDPGDWIIKGVKGEFYPCKPDIFAATYEAVE